MPHFDKIKVLPHAAFWLFIFLFIFDYHFLENNWGAALGATFLEVLTYEIMVYLNLMAFIPVFLKKGRAIGYVLSLSGLVASYVLLMRLTGWERHFYELGGWRNVFSMVLNTSLFLLVSTLFWYFKQWQVERERLLLLKNEKLEAEMNFLRAQISPHFLFNTLNNIYTLALQKHDNAAPMVAKLSTLMRYVLYEGAGGQVFLKKEIETLRQYVELHLLRKPRSTNVDFYVEGNLNGWKIAPLLLINFVENCFKHSNLEQDENAFIKINCDTSDAGWLLFTTENSCRPPSLKLENSNFGLQNARRQLDLNYAGSHSLEMSESQGVFKVSLSLPLQKA